MSQVCEIELCRRTARALCHCCQQNICIVHLNEHNNVLNSQLDPLIDQINLLDNRLRTLNIQTIVNSYREKLEQWRLDSHKEIDRYFEDKCQELKRLVVDKFDEQQEELGNLQSKLSELIHEQQITRDEFYELALISEQLEHDINNIEENFIELDARPLILDFTLISIKGINEQDYDLSILSPVYKSINRPAGSYGALACSNKYLLIHQAPSLCLVDQDLTIIKNIPWRHGAIYDICWSTVLNLFIVLDQKHLYFVDEKTMSIEKVSTIEKRKWLSCTCLKEFLFLSTNEWGSSITKILLNSSKKLDKQWQSPDICKKDEYIDVITNNKRKIAMIIRNSSKQTVRFELRSPETLDRIWSIILNDVWSPNKPFHCCPFINDDWIVADHTTGRLLHITRTGLMKSTLPYNSIPYCVARFGINTLAVSANDGIHFHNLNYRKTYTIFLV
ncbi:unnamed protein product [Rotaria magnacalcarata]|uniref:Uncharacterized protein n=2 Tax=Rotaria magnacalcarata TaxID=392030 RepID=A0A819E5B0_9BILA|nr:unnamed protein product [Rotaria magnacalcarata]CAF3844195.1 unnamed protein product [Rotaria magnacalcarata]